MDCNVFTPIELPCGRTVENRLVKAAMYEHMSNFSGGPPNVFHYGLYSEWAKHGWGMIITGNVQVSPHHLTLGRDIVVPATLDQEDLKPFEKLAQVIHGGIDDTRSLAIMQLSHAGRQSPNFIGGRLPFVAPLAPSPIRVGECHPGRGMIADFIFHSLFQVPKGMTTGDILYVQSSFVRGALLAHKSGFDGVQLHAAHGYLLAQFMNPKSNIRNDEYSVALENASRMLFEIVEAIRKVVPTAFVVGIKINSADYVTSGGSEEIDQHGEQRILDHIRSIGSWGIIDFIEISGGDYEMPDFLTSGRSEKLDRQAFFARFSQTVMKDLRSVPFSSTPLILLTGGLRSLSHIQTALTSRHADLLGIGRGAVLCPDLPRILRLVTQNSATPNTRDQKPFAHEPEALLRASKWIPSVKLIGAGVGTAWYTIRMRDISISQIKNPSVEPPPVDYNRGGLTAVFKMWAWFDFCTALPRVLGILLALSVAIGFLCYH
ncbi:FMN-linked oxidoreductase [Rhizopogon vinicolor AM-OR11-026]|uniref:FMN-linked oxidoreductase n=1 Tax=Rhizopogon vinicolor AM-OR11-026 TaxID=1314800 RepID=A0A1B7NCV6_9AGAM|nr:FMN-linked oxidoreductase [Rhizopogon vinicolor AM-OR11-026]